VSDVATVPPQDAAADPREPRVIVLPDAARVSAAAAESIAAALALATQQRGRADFATTGGSTPIGIYRRLAAEPLRSHVAWRDVHVWWSDDRFVLRDDPLCNAESFDRILLGMEEGQGDVGAGRGDPGPGAGGVPIPARNVHPVPCADAIAEGRGPEWSAARYAEQLAEAPLRRADGWPVFDLVLLGIGPDGHVMSVFPDSPAFDSAAWALGIDAPTHVAPHLPRVTLNPGVLDVAGQVLLVTFGQGKADVVGRVFSEPRDERRLPAQRVRRAGVTWIMDEAAASRLPPGIARG
jgi:6-phosphogluconolactonase